MAGESATLQTARRDREICEVLTDDTDHFKVIVDARLKLEKGHCSCHAVHCEGRQSRETSDVHNFNLMPEKNSQIRKIQEHAEK